MISLLLYFCVAIVLLFYFDDANVKYILFNSKQKEKNILYINFNYE
nr:MAG TPA: Mature oligodendrocyte transmembrane protein [Bacteriophage sp.]DAY16711.1 MAG TPA: Mature oligodendrocyte transmembrane protein [Caudoviricetes sp.]